MWWWKRGPDVKPDPTAKAARIKAERMLERQHEETSRVEAMTAGWRHIREENHFAAAINATFGGGRR